MSRSSRRVVGAVLVLAAILPVAVYLLRDELVGPLLARRLEAVAQTQLGLRLRVGAITGSYLTGIELTEVRTLEPAPEGPLAEVGFRALRVRYSLAALFEGLEAFLARTEIELDGLRLALRLAAGEKEGEDPGAPAAPVTLPGVLPLLRVRDAAVQVRGEGVEVALAGLSAEAAPGGNGTTLVGLRAEHLAWVVPGLRSGETPLAAELSYSPAELRVRQISFGDRRWVESARVGLAGLPAALDLDADLRVWGGSVQLKGSFAESALEASLFCQGVGLGGLAALVEGDLALGGTLDARAQVQLDSRDWTGLESRLELHLAEPAYRDVRADSVDLSAVAQAGLAKVERLRIDAGVNQAAIQDLSVPLQLLLEPTPESLAEGTAGSFSVTLEDLPGLLRMAAIELPAATGKVPPHRLELEGEFRASTLRVSRGQLQAAGGTLRLEKAELRLPTGVVAPGELPIQADLRVNLPDLSLLSELLPMPRVAGSARGTVVVSGTLGAPRGNADLSARGLVVEGIPLGDFTLLAAGDAHRLVVKDLGLRRGGDRVTGSGRLELATRDLQDVILRVSVAELAPYAAALAPPEWAAGGKLEAEIELEGALTAPRGRVVASGDRLNLRGIDLGKLTLRAQADEGRVVVQTLELGAGEDRLRLRGAFELPEGRLDAVSVDLTVADLGPYVKGLDGAGAEVSGRLVAAAELSGPLDAPTGWLRVELRESRFGDLDVAVARLQARFREREIHLEEVELNTSQGDARAIGTVLRGPEDRTLALLLEEMVLTRDGVSLALEAPARLDWDAVREEAAVAGLDLRGDVGRVLLDGSVARLGDSDLTLALQEFTGTGWLEALVGDRVAFSGLDLEARMTGSTAAPQMAVEGRVESLGGAGVPYPFAGTFDLTYGGETLAVRRFEWDAAGGQRLTLVGRLPLGTTGGNLLAAGPIELDATLELPDLGGLGELLGPRIRMKGLARGSVRLGGTWEHPTGRLWVRAGQLEIPADWTPAPPGPYALEAELTLAGTRVGLERLQLDSAAATLGATGQWVGVPRLRELMRTGASPLVGEVELEGRVSLPDLAWLAPGVEGVRRLGGSLVGEVRVSGPIRQPQVVANLTLADAEVRPEAAVPSLRALNGQVAITADGARIESLQGEIGGAPFRASGTLAWAGTGGPRVDLALVGQDLLLFRNESVRLRADADLTVRGPLQRLEIGGNVALTDGRFAQTIDFLDFLRGTKRPATEGGFQLFSLRDPPLKEAVFHLRVSSRQPFQIRTNVARGAARPELLLTGTGEIPVLTGEVYLEPTTVNLPAGRLRFESGVVRFLESDPDRPRLDLLGRSMLLGYDITVQVEGPFDEPVVTLSSVPPVPEEELLLLVLTGRPPRTPTTRGSAQQGGMNVAVYLGKGVLAKMFGGEASDESVLDRFDVEIGRGVTRTGDETLDATFRLAEGVLHRQDVIYLTGEKDVYDDFNVGVKLVFRFR